MPIPMHQRRKHTLKAELTTDHKFILQDMARDQKRSVKKQVEWILVKHIEEYYELTREG